VDTPKLSADTARAAPEMGRTDNGRAAQSNLGVHLRYGFEPESNTALR